MNYNINNGSIDGSRGGWNGGILGQSSGHASMKNSINTANITSTGTYTGGLVGYLSGDINTIENCYNSGTINGRDYVGGIIGNGYNTINFKKTYNIGEIIATGLAGGIMGRADAKRVNASEVFNSGNINCFSGAGLFGQITAGKWENIYNVGNVTGSGQVAGIVFSLYNGSGSGDRYMKNVYNAGNITSTGNQYSSYAAGISPVNYSTLMGIINLVNAGTISCTSTDYQTCGANGLLYKASSYENTLTNVYSLGSVSVANPSATNSDYRAYALGTDLSRLTFVNSYYKSGIALNIAVNLAAQEVSEISANNLPSLTLEVINGSNVFKADTSNANKGYPMFKWQ